MLFTSNAFLIVSFTVEGLLSSLLMHKYRVQSLFERFAKTIYLSLLSVEVHMLKTPMSSVVSLDNSNTSIVRLYCSLGGRC